MIPDAGEEHSSSGDTTADRENRTLTLRDLKGGRNWDPVGTAL